MDYLSQDVASVINYPGSFKNRMICHIDASDFNSLVKGYVATTGTVTGTSGTTSLTTSADLSLVAPPGAVILVNSVDLYTISTINATTITTVETLSANYIASAISLDRITTVQDKGLRGNNLAAALAAQRFIYIPSGINGLPSFASYQSAMILADASGKFDRNPDMTICMVLQQKLTATGNADYNLVRKWTGSQLEFLIDSNDVGNSYIAGVSSTGADSAFSSTIAQPALNTTMFMALNIRKSRSFFEVNGTINEITLASPPRGTTQFLVGQATAGIGFWLGELCWFDGALTPYEYAHVKDKLSRKWGI